MRTFDGNKKIKKKLMKSKNKILDSIRFRKEFLIFYKFHIIPKKSRKENFKYFFFYYCQ